jgi:hypothetical protein
MFLPRPLTAALTALAMLCIGPPLAVRAQLSSVEPALKRLEPQLRQAWRQDPFTAQRPFPALRLLSGPGDAPCQGPYGAAAPLVRVCEGGRELQLDGQQLAALEGLSEEAGVAFALAYGLGLSLVPPQPPGAPGPQATAGLQAACKAGSLLGRLPQAPNQEWISRALNAASQAYGSADAAQLGTGPQRAYALASGLGATELPCSGSTMARLASGALNAEAADWLRTRGPSVGLDILCRKPPACPRRLGL